MQTEWFPRKFVVDSRSLARGGEPVKTDADKLRFLADWFDHYDRQTGLPNTNDEVQRDLRRIADKLDTQEDTE